MAYVSCSEHRHRLPAVEELLQPEVQLQGPHEQPLPTKI